jgi:hypothetical protein
MAPHRHRKDLAASRRRVEDEGDEEGVLDAADLDDDSLSEGSVSSDEEEVHGVDEISPVDVVSAVSSELPKVNGKTKRKPKETKSGNGVTPHPNKSHANGSTDFEMMINGLKISDQNGTAEGVDFEDLRDEADVQEEPSPAIVNSTAQMDRPQEAPYERRRREHEEYKKKRDADPAFVPNRGAFFMHDHRHAGPAANGFRPFGRGRGRGKPGIGGPYAPIKYVVISHWIKALSNTL